MAAAGVTPEQYVKNVAALHERFTRSMFNNGGREPVEYMRSINARGDLAASVPGLEQRDLSLAEHALRRGSEAWGKSMDAFLSGNLPRRAQMIMLSQIP